MPKGKTRWTPKKRTRTPKHPLGHEENAPTEEEWSSLQPFTIFQVSDEDGREYEFMVGEHARIVPHGREPDTEIGDHEWWICKIVDIRARNAMDVWVKLRWLYSPQDAAGRGFEVSHCGDMERLDSQHEDCMSTSVFDGVVIIKRYDEQSLDQNPIPEDAFYTRYSLDFDTKTLSPDPATTCTCEEPYNPSDSSPETVMHLCPQPKCRKFYHSACVSQHSTARSRTDFLLHDPDTGATIPVPGESNGPPVPKRRRTSQTAANRDREGLHKLLKALPTRLVRAAATPIVRGAGAGAGVGVVGNAKAVVAARRIVCGALRAVEGDEADDVEDWESTMFEGWEKTMPQGWDTWEDENSAEEGDNGKIKVVNGVERGSVKGKGRGRGGRGKGKGRTSSVKSHGTGFALRFDLQCPECGGPI